MSYEDQEAELIRTAKKIEELEEKLAKFEHDAKINEDAKAIIQQAGLLTWSEIQAKLNDYKTKQLIDERVIEEVCTSNQKLKAKLAQIKIHLDEYEAGSDDDCFIAIDNAIKVMKS